MADHVDWSESASAVGSVRDREDMLWSAITGESLEGCPIPELSREEVICWHQLMGDTIEAMHDGVLATDERARALAIRFSSLGGMPHALAGLKRLANQRRDVYKRQSTIRSSSPPLIKLSLQGKTVPSDVTSPSIQR